MTPLYLSQSECADWAGCPLRAHARWFMGLRPPDDEDRPRRVGSMGHAILHDRVLARYERREWGIDAAVEREAAKRGWSEILDDEVECAATAADRVAGALGLDGARVMPDIYTGEPGMLAEKRARADWARVGEWFGGLASPPWRDVLRCESVLKHFSGIEGQPDLVVMQDDGSVAVLDFKFRQKPDLGGAGVEPDSPIPDRQASWYLALLGSLGLRPAGGVEFVQVNAYAGRWLTVDDFVDARNLGGPLVTDRGLPTRDTDRLAEGGGMVSAEVWAEAHRVLANMRLDWRLAEYRRPRVSEKTGRPLKQGDPPDRLSFAEERDARHFIEELAAYEAVSVRRFRADPSVVRDVVRDMIVGVDGPLAHSLRGMAPARHLQVYRTAPCVKPRGCQIQVPCMASHGTGDVLAALREVAEQGALVRARSAPALGVASADLSGC